MSAAKLHNRYIHKQFEKLCAEPDAVVAYQLQFTVQITATSLLNDTQVKTHKLSLTLEQLEELKESLLVPEDF